MPASTGLLARLRALLRPETNAQLDDELRFHLEMEAAALERAGMDPDRARAEAHRRFGGVDRYSEELRDVRGSRWAEWLAQDARYALRTARRFPAFTAIVVLTLGFAIGANTAIFSVIDAVLLRPLPFPHAEQLAALYAQNPDRSLPRFSVSYADFLDWKRQTRSFTDMAAFASTSMTILGDGEPERLAGVMATSNFFDVLGTRAAKGRLFGPEDAKGESSESVILMDGFWQRRFGGDPAIIGKRLQFAGRPRTVIGVLPREFQIDGRPIDAITVFVPSSIPNVESHAQHMLESIARVRPGVSVAQADQDLKAVAARLADTHQDIKGWSTNVFGVRSELSRTVKQPLLVLLAASALVLLIGCINVANLLITRAASRGREVALRQAIGASRSRLVSQLLVESAVLATAGGALGIGLGVGGTKLLKQLAPPGLVPRLDQVTLDVRVLGFALALSLVTAMLVGLWPAFRATNPRLAGMLRDGGRTSAGSTNAPRLRRMLVVAEVSLALVLLACSGLVLQSLGHILNVDPGFQVDRVITMRLTLSPQVYPDSSPVAFYRNLTSRLDGRAGIESSAAANTPPLSNGGIVTPIRLIGKPAPTGEALMSAVTAVTPGYFRTAGIRLLNGRDVSWSDAKPVLLLSDAAARQFWPGENAIGKRIGFGRDTLGLEIVGVVAASHTRSLVTDPIPVIYMSYNGAVSIARTMTLLVRGPGDPASLVATTKAAVHEIDPRLPIYNVQTLRQIVDLSVAQPRLNTMLLAVFAGMALLLAGIGIYGVVSYSVAQRTQELGVRIALGAQQSDVFRLVLREGAALAAIGVIIGVAGTFAATPVIQSWLFGIGRSDPATLIGTAGTLVLIALAASYVPARRATKVDPLLAMRAE